MPGGSLRLAYGVWLTLFLTDLHKAQRGEKAEALERVELLDGYLGQKALAQSHHPV